MKQLHFLLFLLLAAVCAAQSREDEIPVFDLDDYLVVPKMNLSVGFRALSGQKLSISGSPGVTGLIQSVQDFGDVNAEGVVRNYHTGYVSLDTRKDADGNPIVDGRTNTWGVLDERQLINGGSDVTMHSYTAQVHDNTTRRKDGGNSYGVEIVASRDMGTIGRRVEWKLLGGISLNGINDKFRDSMLADVLTVTDTYSLNGQTLPTPPYYAPSSALDEDGNIVDTTVFLGQRPDSRTTVITPDGATVSSYWQVKGSYLTARLGPSLTFILSKNFRFTVSGGAAVAYVGTNYTVEQTFTPEISDAITTTVTEADDDLLQGYYVDASLEYLLGDRAGLYMGAFYQSHGQYVQSLTNPNMAYTARIDLDRLQGLRAGLNFKF